MNQEYKEKLSRKIENNYSTLEERIMQDIVRRIKKTGKITSTADWQINRLLILGNSSEDIEKMLKETLDASYPEMFELYDKVIDWEYVRNKDIYEQVNAKFIPYDQNKELQQITDTLIRQTKGEMENITQSIGFYLDYGNGNRILTPLAEVYQNYLDNACMDIASGTFSYNEVLRRTVTQLTNSGLRTIEFASGRAYRVNVAARMAVMTGISQLTGHISDMNAEKLGTEHFEVAWHGGARPEHAVWQGKVWNKEQLRTVCGLGTVTGLLGANCYHEYYPFFPGISERSWTDEWLEEQNRKENTPKEWFGREYTTYEAKQKQRQMETAMRAQRQKVKLLQEGDADPDEVMLARCKYQAQLDEYARFSKKMGLKQERERIYLDMHGRVAPGKNKGIYPKGHQEREAKPQGWRRQFMDSQRIEIEPIEEVEMKEFKPAKSLREAEIFGKTYSLSGEFSITDPFKVEIINGFNEAADNVQKRFGRKLKIKGIGRVKASDSRYHQASYDPTTQIIKLKNSSMQTYEENAKKHFNSGWNASKDKYGTFYHEIGHVIWEDLSREAKSEIRKVYSETKHGAYAKWMEMGANYSGYKQADIFGKELSRYAIENEQEFFSEAFSQIMSGRMRAPARRVNDVLNNYYKVISEKRSCRCG